MELRNLFSTLDISASALDTLKTQLSLTAENIANAGTTRTEEGVPYKRKYLVQKARNRGPSFATLLEGSRLRLRTTRAKHVDRGGFPRTRAFGDAPFKVEVEIEEEAKFKRVYEPDHPLADEDGYVEYPDIDVVWEMLELITVSRAFEANVAVMTAVKNLSRRAMEI